MTDNIFAFDFNGVKIFRDSNTELITLKGSVAGSVTTLTDIRDASQYQVPVGKKARIIFVTSIANSSMEIFYADDLNGTTNQVTLLDPNTSLTNLIFISASVPAGKYINSNVITGTYEIQIIEEEA